MQESLQKMTDRFETQSQFPLKYLRDAYEEEGRDLKLGDILKILEDIRTVSQHDQAIVSKISRVQGYLSNLAKKEMEALSLE